MNSAFKVAIIMFHLSVSVFSFIIHSSRLWKHPRTSAYIYNTTSRKKRRTRRAQTGSSNFHVSPLTRVLASSSLSSVYRLLSSTSLNALSRAPTARSLFAATFPLRPLVVPLTSILGINISQTLQHFFFIPFSSFFFLSFTFFYFSLNKPVKFQLKKL